jgi:hypothetical protein
MMSAYLTEFMQTLLPPQARLTGMSLRFKAYGFAGDEFTCLRTGGGDGECALSLINQQGDEVMAGTARFA